VLQQAQGRAIGATAGQFDIVQVRHHETTTNRASSSISFHSDALLFESAKRFFRPFAIISCYSVLAFLLSSPLCRCTYFIAAIHSFLYPGVSLARLRRIQPSFQASPIGFLAHSSHQYQR